MRSFNTNPSMLGLMVQRQDLGRLHTDLTILWKNQVQHRFERYRPTQNSERAVYMPPHLREGPEEFSLYSSLDSRLRWAGDPGGCLVQQLRLQASSDRMPVAPNLLGGAVEQHRFHPIHQIARGRYYVEVLLYLCNTRIKKIGEVAQVSSMSWYTELF